MNFNECFFYLMAVGALLGGMDCLFGNRFGLGQRFRDGLNSIAPMAANMAGILVIAPVLANLLLAVIVPVFQSVGIDPAMFGSLFATDMGGYAMASGLAVDRQLGLFSGLIVAALLGGVVTYIIPVGFGLITDEDKDFFLKGVMLGMISIPVGSFVGGFLMRIPMKSLLINLAPVCIIAVLLVVGLLSFPEKLIRCFYFFSKGISAVGIIGLMVGALEYLLGRPVVPNATPILEAFVVPGRISVMLMGCLPLMKLLSRLLNSVLDPIGKKLGINGCTLEALMLIFATAIPVFPMLREMPPKGKTAAIAWMVGAMGIMTSHLGFAMGVAPEVCQPQMTAKFISGGLALMAALLIPSGSGFYRETPIKK